MVRCALRPLLDARAATTPSTAPRALDDPTTVDDVVSEQRAAVDTLGAFGVPWLIVGDEEFGFFGPVIGELLAAEEAVALWDHFRWMGTRGYLYEMKRGRKKMQSLEGLSARFEDAIPAGAR